MSIIGKSIETEGIRNYYLLWTREFGRKWGVTAKGFLSEVL